MKARRISASNVGDDVDLNQRVAGNAARCGNGGAHWRLIAPPACEHLSHSVAVLQVIQIHIAFETLFHGGTNALKLFLDGIKNTFGVHFDVAWFVIAHAGDEDQVSIGDDAAVRAYLERKSTRLNS